MMRRNTVYALSVAIFVTSCVLITTLGAQERQIPLETRNFMRAKLKHSQKILEGLSTENFGMISKHAQEMSLLSLESQWNVLRTPKYVEQSADFRHAAQRLIESANSKQLDAATLGYMDVVLKCIHCHKYVRDQAGHEAIGAIGKAAEGLTAKLAP